MSPFSKERQEQVGWAVRKVFPAFAHEILVNDIANIFNEHITLPVEHIAEGRDKAAERLLAGGDEVRRLKAQWLRAAADGQGLPVVRIELTDAVNRFAEKLGIKVEPSLVLRGWADVVDPEWDEKVAPPTLDTFAKFLPPVARRAVKEAQNRPLL
jgi:hypothetical protein